MDHVLHAKPTIHDRDVMTRFDPAYWTVDFPRPMMAAVTTTAPDALRVDCVFYRRDDLAGVIWEAEDRHDHPLLAYETARDFRDCTLSFRWRSHGLLPLDAVNGPVLTIEGRDAAGAPRAWYVRLWNYAVGTPTDAQVTIDFATVAGGFALPGEADPVFAGDIDRTFVSLVPPGYDVAGGMLAAPVEAWAEMSEIACGGAGATIAIGDVVAPEHGLSIASGYDDSYHLTPARLLRNAHQLGYRDAFLHYVGMSHYPRLAAGEGSLVATLAGGALNTPCAAWHGDLAARAKALGYTLIWSLSYELFDSYCPTAWKQRAADGGAALTGWVPPSTLLSPANGAAMAYLQSVARAFVAIGSAAGLTPHFQIGEPWWWVRPDGQPCLYDAAAVVALTPAVIATVRGPLNAAQRATLDRAGEALAASTAALREAVRAERGDCVVHLLAYLPSVLDAAAPEVRRMNMPVGWAAPAYDVLQLEDYDWVTAGDAAASATGVAAATARLGYPVSAQHYLSGFAPSAAARGLWRRIVAAAGAAVRRGTARVFVWALPQVLRDGLCVWAMEDAVEAFDDVDFPIALGREAEVAPAFLTQVVAGAGGHEARNAAWASARTRYDVGPGVRSEADVATLLAFFRARMGPARGFRLRDPFDARATDVLLGTGDGAQRSFALVKRYGAAERRITRPVAGSVAVRVGGVATQAFSVVAGGTVVLDVAPGAGAAVTATFDFDVPVRFAEDSLSVSRATFLAGTAPSVPLTEIREA